MIQLNDLIFYSVMVVLMIGVGVTNTAVVAHRSTVIRSQSFEIHAGTGIKAR